MEHRRDRATALIVRDGKLLLIKRVKLGKEYYVYPGGGIEEGEGAEAAIRREVKEETGFEVVAASESFILDNPERGNNHFFLIEKYHGEEPRLGGPEEQLQDEDNQYSLEWIRISDLAKIKLMPEEILDKVLGIFTNIE